MRARRLAGHDPPARRRHPGRRRRRSWCSTTARPRCGRALLAGAGLLASEQVGIARWCLDETVAYLKVRRQFGRVVGGFQALKHRLADLYAEVESASAAARYAAAALAAGTRTCRSRPASPQAYCSDVAVHAAEEAVQLHGGIGMTWEHPAHLYLKRAKADQIAFGTAGAHRAALADTRRSRGGRSRDDRRRCSRRRGRRWARRGGRGAEGRWPGRRPPTLAQRDRL